MQITAAQMGELRSCAMNEFKERLTGYFRIHHHGGRAWSGEVVPVDAELDSLVSSLVESAISYNIKSELGIGYFVLLGIKYSRKFFLLPAISAILCDMDYLADQNIQRILEAVIAAEEGRKSCHPWS
jgi:hypothetical protein